MGQSNIFTAETTINAPAEDVFRWHAEPGALERLTPPWEPLEVVQRAPGVRDGDRGILRVRVGPFRVRWEFEHRDYIEGRQFRDVQIAGPFRRWDHTHRITPTGSGACRLEDRIEYELPLGIFGNLLGAWFVRKKLKKLFQYRHRITAEAMVARQR
ncbi:MAG: SRPBCC family protein [Candidatus Acidiferrales bacterium]